MKFGQLVKNIIRYVYTEFGCNIFTNSGNIMYILQIIAIMID